MNQVVKVDGRALRGERNRQLIIDALLGLLVNGNLIPSAQQVADEAGISVRTVFRHFEDMESLFAEIDAAARPIYESYFLEADQSGTLEERIYNAVECRIGCYTDAGSLEESTHVLLWRSEQIRKRYAQTQRFLRKDLDKWLPELESVSKETREAIDGITSFEFFDRLNTHQGLSKNSCKKLIIRLVSDLL